MHAFLLMSVLMAEPTSTSIPIGKSMVEARFGEVSLKLFTYKPPNYSTGPMLMVFLSAAAAPDGWPLSDK